MNIYGLYQNVRNASWQCLLDYNIKELPVNLLHITRKSGIKTIKNSLVNELAPSESGISVRDGSQWFIVYDDGDSIPRRRFTIAHELGHIFLGHELKKGYHTRTINLKKPESEKEADMFAARLLAPACVLWGLDLHTTDEIQHVCNISYTAAQARADRMKILYERNKFLTSRLEQKVFENFREFIEKEKRNENS